MKDILLLDKSTLKTVITALQEFALWVTLSIAVILLVIYIIIKLKNKELLPVYKKITIGVIVGYSITLISIILYVQIVRMQVKGEIDVNFFLFIGFFVLMLLLILASVIINKYIPNFSKYFSYISMGVIIAYAVVLFCLIPTVDEDYKPQNNFTYYLFSLLLVAVIIVLSILFGKDKGTARKIKYIVYAGLCISLSFALSYVKFFSLPMGGSVTLVSMLPLMIYSYIFGARKGVFAGIIYGILQFIQSPQIYQPMQVLLDYPIAFGAIGLAGLAKDWSFLKYDSLKLAVGMIIAVLLRYIAHVISGYYVFYTWSTMDNPLIYSIVYNSFTLVDLLLDLIVGIPLVSVKSFRNVLTNINPEINE